MRSIRNQPRSKAATLIATASFVVTALANILLANEAGADEAAKDKAAVTDKPRELKALLISGGCCHDYKAQDKILTEGISERARVRWTVVHGSDDRNTKLEVYKKADWAKGYDVIVHNECYGGVKDVAFVEAIAKAHHDGVPGVTLHCATHSYRHAKTDAWKEFLGVTSMRHEGHRPLKVKPVAPEHPILAEFPATWPTPNGELYVIQKVWPNTKPLATAFGKDTKKDHVVAWTNRYGKGRMFGTTLGHHNETMAHEVYLGLVTRGLLWACDKLREDGEPVAGYAATNKDTPNEKALKKD